MNRCDDCAEPLFATDFCECVRSHAYGRLSKDSLRAKEQARARQHSCIMRVSECTLIVEVSMPARQMIRFQDILQGEDGLAVVRCFDAEKKKQQLWTSAAQKEVLYDWLHALPQSLELNILRDWYWEAECCE